MSKDNLDYQNISSESSEALNHHSLDSSEITIKVEHLGKVYRLYNSPIDRLKEAIHPFRKKYHKDFFALHDISFEVKKGEAIGIIGKNGSGKSTLLKLITGVLSPSSGNVTVNGRVSSLLELGAGFNPELNGIENIYFYGTINGFSKEEMDSRLESILAFADIGEFVFQPVKSYSSGMYVRLAFAVAIQIDPGILIIDEALSVGDIFFQQKCHARMEELEKKGTTLLFVSHDLSSIEKYCKKVILLKNGRIDFLGDPKEATLKFYYSEADSREVFFEEEDLSEKIKVIHKEPIFNRQGLIGLNIMDAKVTEYSQNAKLTFFSIANLKGREKLFFSMNDWITLYIEFEIFQDIDVPLIGVEIINSKNITVYSKSSLCFYPKLKYNIIGKKNQALKVKYNLKLSILPGEYTISIGLASLPQHIIKEIINTNKVRLEDHSNFIKNIIAYKFSGLFIDYPTLQSQEFPSYGLVDLPDKIKIDSEPINWQ
jgi:ABC-type polysaccharide/polyol phosphate transport system ATPase subunit